MHITHFDMPLNVDVRSARNVRLQTSIMLKAGIEIEKAPLMRGCLVFSAY
jgi:hypothetical protein